MPRTASRATCHPDRKHHAKGLCESCYDIAYAESHREECRAKSRAYYAAHREARNAYEVVFHAALKLEVLNAYGGARCVCCGETLITCLSLDHINGDGAKHRKETSHGGGGALYGWLKGNNYPPGYQVLCFNCNWAKGTNDHCPYRDALYQGG